MAHKIFIEMEKLRDLYCGLGQYCWHMAKNLENFRADYPELQLGYYAPLSTHHLLPSTSQQILELKKGHRQIPFMLPQAGLWHATHQESPYIPSSLSSTKLLLTIHDLNYLLEEKHGRAERWWWKHTLQKKINRSSGIVFISQFTRESVCDEFKLGSIPQWVIYNGLALTPPSILPEMKEWKGRRFFFSIGTVLPKKNFHVLVEMLRFLPEFEIILAGSLFHPYSRFIQEEIKKFGLEKRFHLIGTIDEGTKCWYYQNCEAFLFPSLLEGFGLPVVEAMSFGKPLFLSRHTSLPEIGGTDSFYFDDFSPEGMANTIEEGLKIFQTEPERAKRLQVRSQTFDWSQVAKDYLNVYTNLLEKSKNHYH